MKKIRLGLNVVFLSLISLNLSGCVGSYFGGDVGVTNLHQKARLVCAGLEPPCGTGVQQVLVDPSSNSFGGRVYIGGDLNRYSGLELGLGNYGYASYNVPSPPAPPPCNTPTYKLQAIDILAKINLPFMALFGGNCGCNNRNNGIQGLNVFGKVGAAYVTTSLSGSLTTTCAGTSCQGGLCTGGSSTNGVRPMVGLGVEYGLNDSLGLDVSYLRIISGGGAIQPVDFLGLGLSYHFVEHYCGQFLC